MPEVDVDYVRPVKTTKTSDNFADHVKRGSTMPGLDYVVPVGTTVVASGRGVVMAVSNFPYQSRGKHIIIRHADGKQTHYFHLSKLFVKKGERVKSGERIALSGNTSSGNSTGAHLHFSFSRNGKFIDPAKVLKGERVEAHMESDENVNPRTPVSDCPPAPKPSKN